MFVPDASEYINWGIYMYDPLFDYAYWEVGVQINGKKVDYKPQFYPPHGSLPPTMAPSGSVLTFQAEWWFLGLHAVNVPNACVVP